MAFKEHFVKNSRKKNLLIINCLSAGLLFLLANEEKNFWSNPWFWGILSPKYRKQNGSCIALVIKTKQAILKEFFILRLRQWPNEGLITFTLKKKRRCQGVSGGQEKVLIVFWTQKFSRSWLLEILCYRKEFWKITWSKTYSTSE